jgi:hypothetical protein
VFPPFGSSRTFDLEGINLYDLDDHITIPMFYKAGRMPSFDHALNCDSDGVWTPVFTLKTKYHLGVAVCREQLAARILIV